MIRDWECITTINIFLSISVLMKNMVWRALTADPTVRLRQISLTFLTEGIAVVVNGGVGAGFRCELVPTAQMSRGAGLGGTVNPLPHVVQDGDSVEGDPTSYAGLCFFINLLVYWLTEAHGPIRVRPVC